MSIEDEMWEGFSLHPKRKREEGTRMPSSARKIKKKKRKSRSGDEDIDAENHVDLAFRRLDPQLLADLIAKQTKRFDPHLSLIELEERRIPTRVLVDTTKWAEPRNLEQLPAFLRTFAAFDAASGDLSQAPPDNGAPHTMVVSGSGIRAADVTRVLRQFQRKEATVAKLFAKHIKFSDALAFVQKTRLNFGAGTPGRLTDLFESGALKSTYLQQVVIDCSYVDDKKRNILTMKETHSALIKLLNSPPLRERYEMEQVKIIFF